MYMYCKCWEKQKYIHMVPRVRKNEFKMSLQAQPIGRGENVPRNVI